jgi:hypothetical protein
MGFQVDEPWHAGRSKDGRIKVLLPDLSEYKISDVDESSDPKYYGFVDAEGAWYILEANETLGTYRYFKGTTDYATNWTGRALLVYGYFNAVF